MIPVYIFAGFIESGKTSFIQDTLHSEEFTEGLPTLLLVLETGSVDYDESEMKENCYSDVVYIEKEENLNSELLKKLQNQYQPARVVIEFNGTWNMTNFLQIALPKDWEIAQIMTTIDASTFPMYINNMRMMMYEQIVHAELLICNRCNDQTDYIYLRNNLKSINPSAQIIYETKNGIIDQLPEGSLPYDLNEPIVHIQDQDFGIWYMDAMENASKYKAKKIHVSGMVLRNDDLDQQFALCRQVMVCCEEDITPIGFVCYYRNASQLIPGEWVEVEAECDTYFEPHVQKEIPLLKITTLKIIPDKKDDLVYFS